MKDKLVNIKQLIWLDGFNAGYEAALSRYIELEK